MAGFESQPLPGRPKIPKMDSSTIPIPSSKRRKIIGQCPTCQQSFASRHELQAHMSDPQIHPPASDSDAVSFGELSSDDDSLEENIYAQFKSSETVHKDEPTLDNDGFEFSSNEEAPNMDQDGFEFLDADQSFFPSVSHLNAEQGSVYTMPDSDEQPTVEAKPLHHRPQRPKQPRGGALGVLYCGTCDKYFGNEKVFKRHFMFGAKHGEEPRDMRDLYYRVWGSSWADEMREMQGRGRVEEVHGMET